MNTKENYRQPFKDAISYLRENCTCQTLGDDFNVSPSTVSRWSKGQLPPLKMAMLIIQWADFQKRGDAFSSELEAALYDNCTLQNTIDHVKKNRKTFCGYIFWDDRTLNSWHKGVQPRQVKHDYHLWGKWRHYLDNDKNINKLVARVSADIGTDKELKQKLDSIFDKYPDQAAWWLLLKDEIKNISENS